MDRGDAVGRSQKEIALAVVAEIVAERHARAPPALFKPTAVDPICEMTVDVDGAVPSVAIESATYYFCRAHRREALRRAARRSIPRLRYRLETPTLIGLEQGLVIR